MAAIKIVNLEINQGETFERDIICEDSNGNVISLTGYSARAQIRENYADYDGDASAVFTCTITPNTGSIRISLTDAQTQGLEFRKGLWDLELIDPDSKVRRLIEGQVKISKEVTRSTG